MKNIHVLPTDKPSRLASIIGSNFLQIDYKAEGHQPVFYQNIYITSDEKIKEGDWCINPKNNKVMKVGHHGHHGYSSKKIILTTDADLIKDGVQAIDDEFLEWFIKNPNCEEVKIDDLTDYNYEPNYKFYGIIIPKEEPKQEHSKYLSCCKSSEECHCDKKTKQETLEEVSERFSNQFLNNGDNSEFEAQAALLGVNFGAKWQQERMYREEDMREAFENGVGSGKYQAEYGDNAKGSMNFEYFIKQFKKK